METVPLSEETRRFLGLWTGTIDIGKKKVPFRMQLTETDGGHLEVTYLSRKGTRSDLEVLELSPSEFRAKFAGGPFIHETTLGPGAIAGDFYADARFRFSMKKNK